MHQSPGTIKLDLVTQVSVSQSRFKFVLLSIGRHSFLKLQLIMADHQPLGLDEPQTSSIRGNEGHDSGIVDEHDSDADTILMSSTEFWNGANVENLPVIQNSLILKESTPDSTYAKYPGCRSFDCTHLFQHPAMMCGQSAKRKIETNGVELGELTSLLIGVFS